MQFFYGNYLHADRSVKFKNITKHYTLGQNQRTHILRVDWALEGKLVTTNPGNPQVDLMNQLGVLINAYSVNGLSAGFPSTPWILDSSQAIGGVLVTQPISHGEIKGAEGVTYLYYTFGLQADFPYASPGQTLAFSESLGFRNINGSPLTVKRIPAFGPPIIQQITSQSWYYVTQQGSITTAFANPQPIQETFDLAFIDTSREDASTVVYNAPVMQRGIAVSYTTSWKYEYVSATPLIGYPNIVP